MIVDTHYIDGNEQPSFTVYKATKSEFSARLRRILDCEDSETIDGNCKLVVWQETFRGGFDADATYYNCTDGPVVLKLKRKKAGSDVEMLHVERIQEHSYEKIYYPELRGHHGAYVIGYHQGLRLGKRLNNQRSEAQNDQIRKAIEEIFSNTIDGYRTNHADIAKVHGANHSSAIKFDGMSDGLEVGWRK